MLSVRVPLATIVDPQHQQQVQLSPLKGLSLADKENTVSARRPAGTGRRVPVGLGQAPHRASPAAPGPQRDPRAGQQDRQEDLPGLPRAGEQAGGGCKGRPPALGAKASLSAPLVQTLARAPFPPKRFSPCHFLLYTGIFPAVSLLPFCYVTCGVYIRQLTLKY